VVRERRSLFNQRRAAAAGQARLRADVEVVFSKN
jgi:hypothetical protein